MHQSFVIGFVIYDPVCPINLLQQNNPHQLMGKGHSRKAELEIGSAKHCIRQTEGTSDHEIDMTLSIHSQTLHFFGELYRVQLFSFNLQSKDITILPDIF